MNIAIHQAKALIFPSKWPENCPYIILEALAAGLPIIAKNVGGVKELITNNHTGLLFTNFRELKNIIEKFDSDLNLQEYLSKNSLIKSLKYNSELYYKKLINLYLSLINKTL
jgi:glycosyltransferase involved in cell wall biosynthesis